MSFYMGIGAKLIVRKELRKDITHILQTRDWESTSDPVLLMIYELTETFHDKGILVGGQTFFGNPESPERGMQYGYDYDRREWGEVPKAVFDPYTGYWEFEQEWNSHGIYRDAYSCFEYTIIPYISESIMEIKTYIEDSPGWWINDGMKRMLEDRIKTMPKLRDEDNEELMKWAEDYL